MPNADVVGAGSCRGDAGVFGSLMQDPHPRGTADPGMFGESSVFEHKDIVRQRGTHQEKNKTVPNPPIAHGLFSASAHKLKSFIPSS